MSIVLLIPAQFLVAQSLVDRQTIRSLAEYQPATCLIIYDGRYTCTGTLVNNTSQDGRPLILSSAHCIDDPEQINSVVVVFGRNFLLQNSLIESAEWRSDFGAELLSISYETDHALIELNQDLPDWLMPRFLGWNSIATAHGLASTIHHPTFDFKEFAHTRKAVRAGSFPAVLNSGVNDFWCIDDWAFGSVVEGSSGAALLDDQMRVIGGLSGATVRNGDSTTYFYRLDQAWEVSNLSTILDPEETEQTSLSFSDFQSLQNLTKVSKFNYIDEEGVDRSVSSVSGAFQNFEEFSGQVVGVYLPVTEILADPLNSITISLNSQGEQVFAEEVTLFTLQERVENFIPFLTEVPVDGEISISITLNSDLQTDKVIFPTYQSGDGNELLASLLVRNLSLASEESSEDLPEISLFPNPAERYVFVNQEVQEVKLISNVGKEAILRFNISFAGHSVVDLMDIPAGTYTLVIHTMDDRLYRHRIVRR